MVSEFKVPSEEVDLRISKTQRVLGQKGLGGLFIVQRADLFYFSGTAQLAFLYIPAEGEPLLMVKRYPPRAVEESAIRRIVAVQSVKEIPARMEEYCGGIPDRLGFELDVMPVKEFRFYRRLFKGRDCLDGSDVIKRVRMIKSAWEIEQMERAAELSRLTFDFIRDHIRTGYTEMEFAGMFEAFARKIGHAGKLRVRDYQTEGYSWHLLSGKSGGMIGVLDSPASGAGTSPAFPCGAGYKQLESGEPVMIDLGSVLNGYHFDETRMFAIDRMPGKAMDASLAAIEIQNAVLGRVRPGESARELYHFSKDKARELGYEDVYLGGEGFRTAFVGHGIGVELIEFPFIAPKNEFPLRPGMVFAIEPKMIFKGEFTAGIESVFAVTETGCRLISRVPAQVFVCSDP